MSTHAPLGRIGRASRWLGLFAVLALTMGVAVATGPVSIPFDRVAGTVLRPLGVPLPALSPDQAQVLFALRLPRVLLGALVGAALAVSGAVLQGLFRNPLVDPALIGVSSGGALGVASVLIAAPGLVATWPLWAASLAPSVAAFAGGLAATLIVLRLATSGGRTDMAALLLAGIAINALAGAVLGLFSVVSTDAQLRNLTFWTFGGLGGATWKMIALVAPVLAVALVWLLRQRQALDAFLLGEVEAAHLGHAVDRVRLHAIAAAALAVGTTVAVAGLIGFVGLVVPHLVRLAIGPMHGRLVPAAALLGATLVVAADLAARMVLAPAELPVGIVTALIGAPFFLVLLVRERNSAGAH